MFLLAETASWFALSDPDPLCGIVQYKIYVDATTELTLQNVNTRLWNALNAQAYNLLKDGNLNLDTTIDAALA